MFKALNIQTGEEVVILDAQWNGRIPELRRLHIGLGGTISLSTATPTAGRFSYSPPSA